MEYLELLEEALVGTARVSLKGQPKSVYELTQCAGAQP